MLRATAILLIVCGLALRCAADSVESIGLFVAPDPYSQPNHASSRLSKAQALQTASDAQRAGRKGEAATALRLATEAVHHDPDCEPARRALGYERHDGHWLTPYQLRMAKRGLVWHGQFAWIAPDDLPRYESGERKSRGRWISAESDARRHAHIAKGWQVRTDHFQVTTNHSLEAGAELAGKLEQLYQVWQQLCGDFSLDHGDLVARFEKGRAPSYRSRPFQVIYHRTQAEYNAALQSRQPRIAETIGIYFDRQREAHFFHPGEPASVGRNDATRNATTRNDATLYHEAVHQLFQESVRAQREIGQTNNFWAVEGIATWFESLRYHVDDRSGVHFTIGEPDAGRLPAARRRLLDEGYHVPLAELVTLGKNDLQTREDLVAIYSQSAGLATYFMATPDRRGRFVEYLRQIYANRAEANSLSEQMGKSYAQLDAEYREFLESLPESPR